MKRKDKYVMMKRTTPKRVTLSDGRTFGTPVEQKGRRIASVIKRLLPFGKKQPKESSLAALQKI